MIKNNKGMVLELVLVVMAIMAILGLVFIQLSVAETLHTARDKSRMQAYYLAKSGVEATVAWMVKYPQEGKTLIGRSSDPVELAGSNINGKYIVQVLGEVTSQELFVKGTGTVNGVSASATMTVNTGTAKWPAFDKTLYAVKDLGGPSNAIEIIGGIAYGGNLIKWKGSAEPLNRTYPSIIFPANPPVTPGLGDDYPSITYLDGDLNISTAKVFDTFNVNNLTINVGDIDGNNKSVSLVVNNLNFEQKCTLTINGTRTLFIFVNKGTFSIATQSKVNYNGDPEKLIIFMGPESNFTEGSDYDFVGLIYAPTTDITLNGNARIKGAIIGKNLTLGGNPFVNGEGVSYSIDLTTLPVVTYTKGYWVDN